MTNPVFGLEVWAEAEVTPAQGNNNNTNNEGADE